MCLRECRHDHVTLTEISSPVFVGNIYAVIHSQVEFGKLYYALKEFGEDIGFEADAFAPLSEVDETELVNELQTLQSA